MKLFAYVALIAAASAHETGKPHPHPHPTPSPPKPSPDADAVLLKDLKYIATELKEVDTDLKKIEWAEFQELKNEHHRHHDGGDHHRHHDGGDHHRHHDGGNHHRHHNGGDHHRHHRQHDKKTQGDLKLDVIQLEQIVTGVLKGAVNAEGFNDIATCVQDIETVLGDANTAVADFKKGGASNVIAGLKEMGDLLATVKKGMTDCSATSADWARLEAMAKVIASPKDFVYHVGKDLWINGQEIFGDIEGAITDYDHQNWEGFGEEVGRAAAKTILGQEQLKGDCRSSHSDQASCDADAACSWCVSAAVRPACNSLADAKSLPAAVFKCDKVDAQNLFLH